MGAAELLGMVSPILQPAATIAGAVIGAGAAGATQQQADAFSAQQSSTAWQRGVTDMRAAGINPAVAYSQGSASSAVGQMAQQPNYMEAGQASSAALTGSLMDLKLKMASADNTAAQTLKTISEIPNAASTRQVQKASANLMGQQQKTSTADQQLKQISTYDMNLDAARNAAQLKAQQDLGGTYRTAEALTDLGGGMHSAASAAAQMGAMIP